MAQKVMTIIILISIIATNLLIVIILKRNKTPPFLIYYLSYFDADISCHYKREADDLPSIDETFSLPEKSIFFHETSCKGGLNSRQACSIEAAARTNPGWQVNVFFAGPIHYHFQKSHLIRKLRKYPNVKIARLHLREYAERTPMEALVKSEAIINSSVWGLQHTADILRYLSLFKWGGVYLDLDMLLVKSLDSLPNNWVGKEMQSGIGAGAMRMSMDAVGRTVAAKCARLISTNFATDTWNDNSVGIISKVLQELCPDSLKDRNAISCQGFHVLQSTHFYPVRYENWQVYFEPTKGYYGPIERAHGHHLWNFITRNWKIKRNSLYDKLAKKFCPSVYNLYGPDFGF